MTIAGKQYNEGDLLQMQRDAEARVREMQSRARKTVEQSGPGNFQPHNRNWSQNPGMRRQRPGMGSQRPSQPHPRPPEPEPQQSAPPPEPPPHDPAPPAAPEKKDSTIVGDIMAALKLDEDYLLIVGLMLILLNQRADTTLILALAYLLI